MPTTELHTVVARGDTDAVVSLLCTPAISLLDVQDDKGRTPLHLACGQKAENIRCLCALLDAGADPTLQNERKHTPLFTAALTGKYKSVALLVAMGGSGLLFLSDALDPSGGGRQSPAAPTRAGETAASGAGEARPPYSILHHLIGSGLAHHHLIESVWRVAIALDADRALLASRASADCGSTLLHSAAAADAPSSLLLALLRAGADPLAADAAGRTCIQSAARFRTGFVLTQWQRRCVKGWQCR
jgi:ankyrin repeat protein